MVTGTLEIELVSGGPAGKTTKGVLAEIRRVGPASRGFRAEGRTRSPKLIAQGVDGDGPQTCQILRDVRSVAHREVAPAWYYRDVVDFTYTVYGFHAWGRRSADGKHAFPFDRDAVRPADGAAGPPWTRRSADGYSLVRDSGSGEGTYGRMENPDIHRDVSRNAHG